MVDCAAHELTTAAAHVNQAVMDNRCESLVIFVLKFEKRVTLAQLRFVVVVEVFFQIFIFCLNEKYARVGTIL